MKMEFILCEINKKNKLWGIVSNYNSLNEFIIVGEEITKDKEYYKIVQCTEDGIRLIDGLMLDEVAYLIEKIDINSKKDELPGTSYTELDIPKEYLTLNIIENVQRLNA